MEVLRRYFAASTHYFLSYSAKVIVVNKQLSCVRAGMWAHHCFGRSVDWQASYLDLVARLGVDHNDLLPTAGPENSSLGLECGHFQFSRELTKMVPNSTHRQYILFEKNGNK